MTFILLLEGNNFWHDDLTKTGRRGWLRLYSIALIK